MAFINIKQPSFTTNERRKILRFAAVHQVLVDFAGFVSFEVYRLDVENKRVESLRREIKSILPDAEITIGIFPQGFIGKF